MHVRAPPSVAQQPTLFLFLQAHLLLDDFLKPGLQYLSSSRPMHWDIRRFTRAPNRCFRGLAMARADGSLRSPLSRLSLIDVLVIDDWAMTPLSAPEHREFAASLHELFRR